MESDILKLRREGPRWQGPLHDAIGAYLAQETQGTILYDHIALTPERVVRAFEEYTSGCRQDPASVLTTLFPGVYDEMVHVTHINVVSMCAHHLCPIIGKAHFAYVPDGRVVGLSKIPRMVNILARRPQIQEDFTEEIVDTFYQAVRPKGCAVSVKAYHFCMIARGVREQAAVTATTAMRGCFKEDASTRAEFLAALDPKEIIFP